MEAAGAEVHYAERLAGLPESARALRDPRPSPRFSRAAMNLLPDAHLYACPQSLFKIHPDNDDLFLDIAERDRHAVFLFFQAMYPPLAPHFRGASPCAPSNAASTRAAGLFRTAPERARISRHPGAMRCIARYLALVWRQYVARCIAVAAPIVTLPGQFMRGRQTMAMLQQAGVPELIASSRSGYMDMAIAIASDTTARETSGPGWPMGQMRYSISKRRFARSVKRWRR